MSNKSEFGLSAQDCSNIKDVFSKYPQIEGVVLYGSRAKGNFRSNSDIDMTIQGNLGWNTFTSVESDLDDLLLPYKIDLSLFEHLENELLIEHINRVGKIFYTKTTNKI